MRQAIVGLRTLLRTLYSLLLVVPCPHFAPIATPFHEQCSGDSGSHDLLLLEQHRDTMMEYPDSQEVGLASVFGDVVESTNYILARYNEHSARGGGLTAVQR